LHSRVREIGIFRENLVGWDFGFALLWVKSRRALHKSAFDPKRTLSAFGEERPLAR